MQSITRDSLVVRSLVNMFINSHQNLQIPGVGFGNF